MVGAADTDDGPQVGYLQKRGAATLPPPRPNRAVLTAPEEVGDNLFGGIGTDGVEVDIDESVVGAVGKTGTMDDANLDDILQSP